MPIIALKDVLLALILLDRLDVVPHKPISSRININMFMYPHWIGEEILYSQCKIFICIHIPSVEHDISWSPTMTATASLTDPDLSRTSLRNVTSCARKIFVNWLSCSVCACLLNTSVNDPEKTCMYTWKRPKEELSLLLCCAAVDSHFKRQLCNLPTQTIEKKLKIDRPNLAITYQICYRSWLDLLTSTLRTLLTVPSSSIGAFLKIDVVLGKRSWSDISID